MKASDFTGIRKQLVSLAATAAFAGLALIAGSADAALIAHYELDGNALDSSGNSNDGTLVGDTSFVTGIDGQAAEFDGNGDDITATVTGLPFGNAERTISLWVNPDQSRFDQKFFDYGNSAQNGKAFSFTIEDSGGSPTIFFRHSGGNFQYTSASIALDEWSHVAMVVPTGATQTDDVLVYLNGSQLTGVQGGAVPGR